ncbi:MAG: sigma-70 family polymerase sigma factor [Actinomycetia bacterium]|nr:sigma-70 family polymerase sigma factor [Actinomycetes bacterium]
MEAAPADLVAFCAREWSRLVGTLTLYTGDRLLGEELAQETLARVCRDWARIGNLESPGGWAHRVGVNLANSHRRRQRSARRAASRMAQRPDAAAMTDLAAAVAIRGAVAKLPERQRRALVLRYYADLSVREVADAMRVPEGTVKTLTRRAIERLRAADLLGDAEFEREATDVH